VADIGRFISAVHERYGMRPVVPLEFPIEIGDIGKIAGDGSWKPISTVRHRFNSAPGGVRRTRDDRRIWEVSSGRDVTFTAYQRGETSELIVKPAEAKPRAEICFASDESFVFAASEVTIRTATQVADLIDKIRLAYTLRRQTPEDGRWYKEYAFVFAVGDAQCFTALLPKRAPTTVAVIGRGPVGPPASPEKLARGIRFGVESAEVQRVHQNDARGRFYRAYRLTNSILERWREEPWHKGRNGEIHFEMPTPSFEETFEEI
jgi:hypothetical protein